MDSFDKDLIMRRSIKDQLIKIPHMNFNQFSKKRRASFEQALLVHQRKKKIVWQFMVVMVT